MKRWVVTTAVTAGLAGLAGTARWWLPPLLRFAGAHRNVIQGLGALVQLTLWAGSALALLYGLWRSNKPNAKVLPPDEPISKVQANHGSVAIGRDAVGSTIITGNDNVVIDRPHCVGDVVSGDKITIHEAAAPPTTALHQLPPALPDFTGREQELARLMAKMRRGGVTIAGLHGMGGVGKTALALKLAHLLSPQYPDAQFYFDLKGVSSEPASAGDAMRHVVRACHPGIKLPDSDAELKGVYLSTLHNKRALLILDNAGSAEQVEPLIPPEGCAVLVTSRQNFILPGLFAIQVDSLPLEDSVKLLLKIAPRIREHASSIAELCGCLPLTLRIAASLLAERRDRRVDEYERRLGDDKQRLKLLGPVEVSLGLSYELVGEERQKLWRVLAVFPETFEIKAAVEVWELDVESAQEVLSELLAYSLLEWNESTHRYRLHDLSRLHAGERLSEPERVATQQRLATHYLGILRESNELYERGAGTIREGLELFDLEWPNIQVGQAWAEARASVDEAAARLCDEYACAGINLLYLRQLPRQRIHWLEAALRCAERTGNLVAAGMHLGNLGNAYANLADLRRAMACYQQALEISRQLRDERAVAQVLANMGSAMVELGDARMAITYSEQALQKFRSLGDRRDEGQTLSNFGNAYAKLGDLRRAVTYYEQSLMITREIGDRQSEGQALSNLAAAYNTLGEPEHAIDRAQQALAIAEEMGDTRSEGSILCNLGLAHAAKGDHPQALQIYRQALMTVQEIEDTRNEANIRFNMSLALSQLGRYGEAITQAEAALKIYERLEDSTADRVRNQLAQWRKRSNWS